MIQTINIDLLCSVCNSDLDIERDYDLRWEIIPCKECTNAVNKIYNLISCLSLNEQTQIQEAIEKKINQQKTGQ